MITVSKEDYLKAILEAECEGEQVIAARLAQWLSVSAPAVTMALRRLKRDRLVSVRQDGRIQLTATGRKIARQLVTRHHLIERMLHEVFGMTWYKVHDEAERLEHAVSGDFETLLVKKLGRGGACPHGNAAIPEQSRAKRKRGLLPLSESLPGGRYAVRSIYERDRKLLEFLEHKGIRPGTGLKVNTRNYDGTLSLAIDGKTTELGGPAAEKIWVSKAS
ncbi:MAG TPA: metal-dependent transcriptional regulator [Terriglobales bacterium]|jgi:DtxR family Mn-dependent transcriptional regulator